MRITVLFTAALLLAACATKPAQIELMGCESYATALGELAGLKADHKLSATQIAYIDKARPGLNAICEAPPPDISQSALNIALDAGTKALLSIVIQVKGQ